MHLRFLLLFFHPIPASIDVDAGYSAYLSSDMYIDSIRSELMPENCFLILLRKFSADFQNVVYENALNHIGCDNRSLHDGDVWVNPDYHPDIPFVDFILSPETMRLLMTVNDRAYSFGAHWPRGHQSTNLAAYHLSTVLNQRSTCETLDCRVFRKIIEQFHFRLSTIIHSPYKPAEVNFFQFILPINVLVSARQNMETFLLASLRRPPKRFVGLSARITQSACWSCFFGGRSAPPSASAVEPLLDSWGSIRHKQLEQSTDSLLANADVQLESVRLYIQSVMDSSPCITGVHNQVIRPLMAVARGVSVQKYGSEMERPFRFLFHLVVVFRHAEEMDQNKWQQNLHLALDCVSQLRYFFSQVVYI